MIMSGCASLLHKRVSYHKSFPIVIKTSSNIQEGSCYIVSEGEMVSINISESGDDKGGKFLYANICLDDNIIHRTYTIPCDYKFAIKDLDAGEHKLSFNIHMTQFGTEKQLNPAISLFVK